MSTPVVPVISRRVVMASLVAIAALAAAPFVVAVAVSDRRIDAAEMRTSAIASVLRDRGNVSEAGAAMLIGTGNVPQFAEHVGWPTSAGEKADLPPSLLPPSRWSRFRLRQGFGQVGGTSRSFGGPREIGADPWRNAYVVNIGAQGPVWVLSAGPNGILETPFDGVAGLQGDDVGSRVR